MAPYSSRSPQIVLFLLLALLLSACAGTSVANPNPTALPATELPATELPATELPAATPTLAATVPPTLTPSVAPTIAPTATPLSTPLPTATPVLTTQPIEFASAVLFLRDRELVYLRVQDGTERVLADNVRDFAATPDGLRIALVRELDDSVNLWTVERDGSRLRQVTIDPRTESSPTWAADGSALAYVVATTVLESRDWEQWSRWCASAEVRLFDFANSRERSLGPGCDPAFAPNGLRIAFVTPPALQMEGFSFAGADNALRIVNRQGQNGWNYANGGPTSQPLESMLVYAPTWSPGGEYLAYQRFLGYQALVDINLTEWGGGFRGPGAPISVGAGWLLPAQVAPDGERVAVVQHHFGDPRGFTGYDTWSVSVMTFGENEVVAIPAAEITLNATRTADLAHVTAAAWAPNSNELAVILPEGWQPGASTQEPAFPGTGRGALWLWTPGSTPATQLTSGIDFGSPLIWVPPLR